MGIFGLGGGVMVLASLIFASQTFILPQTASQLAELPIRCRSWRRNNVRCRAAFALRSYLPKSPVLRPLMLNPPEGDEREDIEYREAMADFSHLVAGAAPRPRI